MPDAPSLPKPGYGLLPVGVEGLELLSELALDMRWSWNHAADGIWRALDAELWQLTHNPWVVLQTVARDRLEAVLSDPALRPALDRLVQTRREHQTAPAWFQEAYPDAALRTVAYFSMEFMLSEALPIYSGGLGNVAGDQLKAYSDLGIPVIGVGLLYQQGYFRQVLDRHGAQQALYPYNDPAQLPITPVRAENGQWLRIEIELPGHSVWLRAWQAQVGRARLYLLDSNDAANFPAHRGITGELYAGAAELRLKQELVLGIGGLRLLAALGLSPEVCHLNEGHAAFVILERARQFMGAHGQPFDVALAATRAGNVFTTHTAVAAGFDRFSPALIEQYLGRYAEQQLSIPVHELLALGRENPNDPSESFNMAYLAIRGSGGVNGVSRLHAEVSRRLFAPLFPRWPEAEVPVAHVTNGVHMPTWDSAAADALWTKTCCAERWLGMIDGRSANIRQVDDAALWALRRDGRRALIEYTRERLKRELAGAGAPPGMLEVAARIFDPAALTLGFARRFATYKRPNLLLHDRERLLNLLRSSERPVQLLLAGKAHPEDREGQALIQQWVSFARQPEVRPHVVFLADYDMQLTEQLVQGVDVWINTPRRPWEACGTSGMKVLVNGGLNLSELDGWWAEAYTPEVGWALGDGLEHALDSSWDAAEAEALYDLLEAQIIPEFYTRDAEGLPRAWLARVRESMASLAPRYSADRAVRDYTEQYYLPAARAYRARAADGGAKAQAIASFQRELERSWRTLHFGQVRVDSEHAKHVFQVDVFFGSVDPGWVCVELFAEGLEGTAPERWEMSRVEDLSDGRERCVYRAEVLSARPAAHYTPRIVPRFADLAVPLEVPRICWQR